MTDLRQAAKAVVDRWDSPAWEWSQQGPTADLIAALRKALAQPEQEPVAWLHPANATCVTTDPTAYARGIPLYTAPPAAPSEWPLIKNILAEYGLDAIAFVAQWIAAQRPWVGLTDEERKDALVSVDAETKRLPPGMTAFARAIEAKLKERNNG